MKIYLTDQSDKFPMHLKDLCNAAVMKYDIAGLQEKKSVMEINTRLNFEDIDTDFLLCYHIFPVNIMAALTQWASENRKMRIGDTIVQQVFIPPVRQFSQKIVFGVRIKDIIDEPRRKGYSYETLEGHVEKGLSAFTLEQEEDGRITFVIQTYSEPATILTKILGPVFALPYQAYCTRHALSNVKRAIEMQKQ